MARGAGGCGRAGWPDRGRGVARSQAIGRCGPRPRPGGTEARGDPGARLHGLPRHAGADSGPRASLPDAVPRPRGRPAARGLAGAAHLAARGGAHGGDGVLVRPAWRGGAAARRHDRDRRAGNGAPHHGARGDRLPRFRGDRGPPGGRGALRLGGPARDRAARGAGHERGALSLIESQAGERRGEDPGDAPGRVSRGAGLGRCGVQQPPRCVRGNAARRADPEAPPRRGCPVRRPGARARHRGRGARSRVAGGARGDRRGAARRPRRAGPPRPASRAHAPGPGVAPRVRGPGERRARRLRGRSRGGARPRPAHGVRRGGRARGRALRRRAAAAHGARMSGAALATLLALQAPPGDGAALYASWCASCHGADGRGVPAASTRLEVPPADLRDCKTSTAEPEDRWIGIVTQGGAAFGLSLDMPAFGEAATPEQVRAVVRYARSLCGEPGWPPGELNVPRAFLAEKAYPENEIVLTTRGRDQEAIYERRLGKRWQLEGALRTVLDSLDRPFGGITAAAKYNAWYDAERRALASVGLEATPPMGRADRREIDPFFAFGWAAGDVVVIQGQVVASLEEGAGLSAWSYRVGAGRHIGRVVPMLELEWGIPVGGDRTLSFYPQCWVQLSRLGHVAASLGAELPAVGIEPRHPRLIAFVLWDYGDAPLFRGW